MTPIEKAIREFCGHHADWWPSTTQVQEMLALAQPCPTCEALARTVMLDQTSHDNFKPDYNTEAVLVEEMQRMAKRIEELEAEQEPVAWISQNAGLYHGKPDESVGPLPLYLASPKSNQFKHDWNTHTVLVEVAIQRMTAELKESSEKVKKLEKIIVDQDAMLERQTARCVGWFGYDTGVGAWFETNKGDDDSIPLYKEPPQRTWVGLTDEDMKDPKTHNLDFILGARWAEEILKDRNI